MGFWNKYPYTDFHELNLDYILKKMKELEDDLDGLLEEAVRQATENAEAYVDEKLANVLQQFNQLKDAVGALSDQFDGLETAFEAFTVLVDRKIEVIQNTIDSRIAGVNARTDALIASNNEFLLAEMGKYLNQITVTNYFTGLDTTIQDMFNYLAMLHLNDSITYATMAQRAKTYTYLVNLNMTYTNLVMHGNTLYV